MLPMSKLSLNPQNLETVTRNGRITLYCISRDSPQVPVLGQGERAPLWLAPHSPNLHFGFSPAHTCELSKDLGSWEQNNMALVWIEPLVHSRWHRTKNKSSKEKNLVNQQHALCSPKNNSTPDNLPRYLRALEYLWLMSHISVIAFELQIIKARPFYSLLQWMAFVTKQLELPSTTSQLPLFTRSRFTW